MSIKQLMVLLFAVTGIMVSAGSKWDGSDNFNNWEQPDRLTAERIDGILKLTITGKDSSISNFHADVDCRQYQRLQIVYRVSGFTGTTTGQLFFRTAAQNEWIHDQYWRLPPLVCDGKWNTMELNAAVNVIGGIQTWLKWGRVNALRLDIVDQFPMQLEIRSIRFLKADPTQIVEPWPDVAVELASGSAEKNTVPAVSGAYFSGVMIKAKQDFGNGQKFDFRRVFTAPGKIQKALLQGCADDAFELYVNNEKVMANDQPDGWKQVQKCDVTKYLKAGQRNIISGTYQNNGGPGGVLLELTVLDDANRVYRVVSDRNFRAAVAAGKNDFHRLDFNSRNFENMIEQVCPPQDPWRHTLDFTDIEPRLALKDIVLDLPVEAEGGSMLPVRLSFSGRNALQKNWKIQFELRSADRRLLKTFQFDSKQVVKHAGANRYTVDFQLPLMRYFATGTMLVTVSSPDVHFAGMPEKSFIYRQKEIDGTAHAYKVVRAGDSDYPVLLQDGKAIYPLIGNTESEVDLRRFAMSKFNLVPMQFRMFWCRNTSNRLWWTAPDKFDFTVIDEYFEALLQDDPNAEVIVGVGTEMPLWWGQQHPEELVRHHDNSIISGGLATTSFASELHYREAARALKKLIEHCSNAPYAKRIAGYQLTNGVSCEWQYWGCHSASQLNKLTDYSLPMQKAFERFAAEKYPEIPAAERTIPTFEERLARDESVFFPPHKQLHNIAFANCLSEVLTDLLLKLTKVARESAGADKLIAVYYGYTFEYADLRWCVSLSGHNALRKVLNSPDIDILISPQSYGVRNIGDSGEDMKPFASIRAAGKLPVIDDDTRTHLTPPVGFYQTLNPRQTAQILRRNFGRALTRHEPLCLLPLGKGVEFSSPEIIRDIKSFYAAGSWAVENLPSSTSDIAVVISEKANTVLGLEKRILPRGMRQSYNHSGKAVTGLRESQIHTGELIYSQRDRIAKSGAAVDYVLAEDLVTAAAKPYKLWIFLNAFNPDADFLAGLDMIRQRGNATLLWLHAPGMFFNDRPADSTLINSMVGMELEKIGPEIKAMAEFANGDQIGSLDVLQPLFAVKKSAGVEPLAVYTDAPGRIAMASVQDGSVRSIFWGGTVLTAEFVQQIAREAGVHIYAPAGDVVYANSRFITFHAASAGEKVLKLPQICDVVDIFEHKIVARGVRELRFNAALHDSYLFALGNADEIIKALNGKK